MASAKITCLCGAINVPLDDPLPAKSSLCHCNSCRHTSGALFAGRIGPLENIPDDHTLSACTAYHSSSTTTRYFCSTCGAKLFIHDAGKNEWHTFAGVVDPPADLENVLDIQAHQGLADTHDGGMASFMTTLGGKTIPLYSTDASSPAYHLPEPKAQPLPDPHATLKAKCHCGGISLLIQRARHDDPSIPQLDRFIPKAEDGTTPTNKHMAFCCTCRSCRLQTGVSSLVPWTYIPAAQILNAHTRQAVLQHHDVDNVGAAADVNRDLTITHFWSSEKSCRSFCRVCGASAFYSTDSRPEVVNVAAGLLRGEEHDDGVMARGWLNWVWGRTAWRDEATQRDVADAWRGTGG
ncbi:hypothetical protein BDY17DRAFT_350868 [Neohortaea acidophila]|uniref:CENP-V/GFA domain-containing protein n=1 Tax=Neohortaea acidophila TaxID=245834 RepID=A0A6A6Q7V1_9PEZI|nr:uncharacterized protein BDY17DRAFT_350868 [Neohortaea acidophila]KAF2488129.1 hypothetical protein BDY17DRAFT_350868 [Neohortaea acidophila]